MKLATRTAFALTLAALPVSSVFAQTAVQTACQVSKGKALTKYTACRHKAEQHLVVSGDAAAHSDALAACEAKLSTAFGKADAKAAAAGAACADALLTSADFSSVIADSVDSLASGLAGDGFPRCGDGIVNVVGELCDGSDLGASNCAVLGFGCGTLACSSSCGLDTSACLAGNACEPSPTIGSVQPSTGSMWGGTLVTIHGTNLGGVTDVSFGGVRAASFTVVSPTEITAVTGKSVPVARTVSVGAPGGAASGPDFQYECDFHYANEDPNYGPGVNLLDLTYGDIPGVEFWVDWACETELGDNNSYWTCDTVRKISTGRVIAFNMFPSSLIRVTSTIHMQPGDLTCVRYFNLGDLGLI